MITLQERVHSTSPPKNWSLSKLHKVLRVRKGYKNTGLHEDNLLSLSYGHVVRKDIEASEGLLPESFETYQIVEPGNIVMRLTDLQNDKRSLRQGLVRERGIITSAYDALEVEKRNDPRFWAYALLALDLAKYYYSLGGGVRQSIKFLDFPNDWIAVPDEEVQKATADFLDSETARIDNLVQRKERLLSVLTEKRRAVTLHVLDQLNAPKLQASSEPYDTGYFDDGWSIRKAKYVVSFMTSGSRGWSRFITDQGELFLQSGNIGRNMEVTLDGATRIEPQQGAEAERTALMAGDVLVCITGGRTGAVGYLPEISERAYINQHVCLLRTRSKIIDPKLLAHILYSEIGQRQFDLFQYGLKQGLGFAQVGEVKVPIPPNELQVRAIEQIDSEMTRIDSLENRLALSINTLREFRTSLITSAVTGQINVSAWRKRCSTDRRLDQIEEEMSQKEATA